MTIDTTAEWEVAYWTRKLGVTPAELHAAAMAAGNRLSELVGFLLTEKEIEWLGADKRRPSGRSEAPT